MQVSKCIVGASIVAEEIIVSSEGLRHADKLMDDIEDDIQKAEDTGNRLEALLTAANVKIKDLTNKSIAFDENGIPIRLRSDALLSAGSFSGLINAKTIYIPDYVYEIQAGTFSGDTNITDIYINQSQTVGQCVVIAEGALPSGAVVNIHYSDNETFGDWHLTLTVCCWAQKQ